MTAAAADTRLRRWLSYSGHPLVRAAVPIAIAAVAIFVLHRLAGEVPLRDVRADLASASLWSLALAVLFTGASFAALSLYDVIAARAVAPGVVPAAVAALASATGYALSNLLGFSYVTGTAVRYRIYAGFGLDMARVATLLAYSWSAIWSGLILLVGALMVLHPKGLAAVLPVAVPVEIGIGIVLLAALAGFFLFLRLGPGHISILGYGMVLPSPGQAAAMTGAALVDITAASLTLYVLMPSDLVGSFPYFFMAYIIAVALGNFSHAPGGLGVFEATILGALGAGGRSDALAALLLYRAIYTGLPFVIAVLGLAATELVSRRAAFAPAAQKVHSIARPFAPLLAAAVAMASGAVLLLSGNLPMVAGRLALLRDMLPLGVVEISHLAGSVAGVFLLVVARSLYRRLYRAWLLALVLLGVGFFASLGRGVDIEESLILAIAAATLLIFRSSFYRVDRAASLHLGPGWFVSIAVLFAALTWIGFFAFKHVDYRDALWWRFTWSGDASRFLRASLAGAVVLAALALNSVIAARGKRHMPQPIPDSVRRLVAASPESEANLALLGDKCFLVDPEEQAFLAYADTGSALVVKGDPVGQEAAGHRLLWQFREMADREGKREVFYAVTPKYLSTFLDMGLAVVKFGEVARVDLDTFALDGPAMKDFRQARNRAARDGLRFEIVPASDFAAILPDVRRVSDGWLTRKKGKEKSFSLGSFDAAYLANFDTAVLRMPGEGRIVAFANLLMGAQTELSVDLMRYDPDGPGFAMDALFAELMLWAKAQGFRKFNLGAAPFSGSQTHALASPWQRIGGFVYEHGEDVYHFEGLRSFKEKFQPVWTPNYIVCQRGLGVARAFVDANLLISGGVAGLIRKGDAASS